MFRHWNPAKTADLRQIRASDGESLRPLLRLFPVLIATHILLVEVLFRAFLRGLGLVGDTDKTVDLLFGEFVAELGFELFDGANAEQQREGIYRDGRVSDRDIVAVGDFVAEPLGVGLDRIAVNLEAVLVLENPFTLITEISFGSRGTSQPTSLQS